MSADILGATSLNPICPLCMKERLAHMRQGLPVVEATGMGRWDRKRQQNGHVGTRMQAGTQSAGH